jgi:hypothetical protein
MFFGGLFKMLNWRSDLQVRIFGQSTDKGYAEWHGSEDG